MVPDSLIFFRVPVSSAAKTGVLIRAAAMAAPNRWGTMRMGESLMSFFIDGAAIRVGPLVGECFNGVHIQTHALVETLGSECRA
ncbi:hypothetical protein IBA8401_04510 [Pseudomonas syringae]